MQRMSAVITAFRRGVLLKPALFVLHRVCRIHAADKTNRFRRDTPSITKGGLVYARFCGIHELKMRTFRTRRLHTRCCIAGP